MRYIFSVLIIFLAMCIWSQNDFVNQESNLLPPYIRGTSSVLGGYGVSAADFNQDGLDDITLATKNNEDLIFYQNTGNGFNKISPPFVSNQVLTKCVIWVDYDNDGDKDLFVTALFERNKLYQNDGAMNFTDVTAAVNLPLAVSNTSGANFGDVNRDGYLDLYITNYYDFANFPMGGLNEFYIYNPSLSIYEVQSSIVEDGYNQSFCSTFFDYDNDDDLDLYIANDRFGGNSLYKNRGNGVFTDVSMVSMAGIDIHAMNTGVGDYNNDGHWDIYVTNTKTHPSGYNQSVLLHNNGDETFTDVSASVGTTLGRTGWAASFFDFDNDMDQDLYVSCQDNGIGSTSAFYVNNNFTNFNEPYGLTGGLSGVDTFSGYNHIVIDADNNGSLDIMNPQFSNTPIYLHLNNSTGNNFFKLDLKGTNSNRDAYGAIAIVEINGVEYKHCKFSVNAFLSQGSDYLHIGIGQHTAIDKLTVEWPYAGSVEVFLGSDIAIGRMNHIEEGTNVVTNSSLSTCNFVHNVSLDPIPTNLYQAINSVDANSILVNGSDVDFIAGQHIDLNAGFEVLQTSTFSAMIGACN